MLIILQSLVSLFSDFGVTAILATVATDLFVVAPVFLLILWTDCDVNATYCSNAQKTTKQQTIVFFIDWV